jgi:autotransporter translocation and assembly factor TamB
MGSLARATLLRMDRRGFIFRLTTRAAAALGLAGAITAFLNACGQLTGSGTSGGDCSSDGTTATIANNHGHLLTVTAAHVSAGTAKSYNIQGTGDHNHTVALTAAHFASLLDGEDVSLTVTGGGHSHTISIACS